MLWSKNANFWVYVDLVRIRLKIMITDFAQEKETFLTTKKQFFKVQKLRLFKVVNPRFWSKNAFFSLYTFDENKTRKTYFDLKKEFFKVQKIALFERG